MRSVPALCVVLALALPVQAADHDRPWFDLTRAKIVKTIKKVVRSFGDGLSDPRP